MMSSPSPMDVSGQAGYTLICSNHYVKEVENRVRKPRTTKRSKRHQDTPNGATLAYGHHSASWGYTDSASTPAIHRGPAGGQTG